MRQNHNDNIEVYRLYGSTDIRFWYVRGGLYGEDKITYMEDSIEKCIRSIFNHGLFKLEMPNSLEFKEFCSFSLEMTNNLEFKEFCSFSFDTKLRLIDDNIGIVVRDLANTYPELFL